MSGRASLYASQLAVYVLPTPGAPMKRMLFEGSIPSSKNR